MSLRQAIQGLPEEQLSDSAVSSIQGVPQEKSEEPLKQPTAEQEKKGEQLSERGREVLSNLLNTPGLEAWLRMPDVLMVVEQPQLRATFKRFPGQSGTFFDNNSGTVYMQQAQGDTQPTTRIMQNTELPPQLQYSGREECTFSSGTIAYGLSQETRYDPTRQKVLDNKLRISIFTTDKKAVDAMIQAKLNPEK